MKLFKIELALPVAAISAFFLFIFSASAETYYVSHTGAGGNPGTEESPVDTIAAALALCVSGDDEIVIEKSDTPYFADNLLVDKQVVIRSSTGVREDVRVTHSDGQKVRIFRLNNAGATLRGLTVEGGNFTTGENSNGGGNVYIGSNGGVVENCILRNANINSESCVGGTAVTINSANGRVSNCVITNNLAGYQTNGGAVLLKAAGLVENCFIAFNKCASGRLGSNMCGAGVKADVSGAKVLNCTIYANESAGYPGVYLGNPFALFQNCLIYGNKGSRGTTGYADIVGGNFNSSTFRNCAARTNDIKDNTSHFFALASLPSVGDMLRPVAGSPLIGAGAVHASAVATTDLDGNPRVVGDKIDIGCFQYQGTSPSIGMTVSPRVFRTSEEVEVTFTASLDNAGAVEYVWDFGDGETVTTSEPAVTHTYAKSGRFAPSVTAGGLTYTATREEEIRSLPDVMFVVKDNAGEKYPYATKETAAKLPQTAIDAAEVDGIEVIICTGTYTSTATPFLKTGITVHGESGNPDDVTIVANKNSGYVRGPYLDHEDALLYGVTLKQGYESAGYGNDVYGIGLCIAACGGTVSNCVIRDVQPTGRQFSSIQISSSKGLVTHCKVTACTTGETNEIGVFMLSDGVVDNCLIDANKKGGSSYAKKGGTVILKGDDAVVRNCTIVNNSMATCGGAIVSKGLVQNCVFANNKAQLQGDSDNYWASQAERFDHCASDDAAPINSTCKTGSAATFFVEGGYVPLAGGPLFNTGVNPDPCEETDFTGVMDRISGGTIDIGAYEADAETFDFEIIPSVKSAVVPATITYQAGLSGTNGTDEIRCYWMFDGTGKINVESSGLANWEYTSYGSNSVSVIVSNLTAGVGLQKSLTGKDRIEILPQTVYVVPGKNETAAWPWDTWEKAATSLNTVIDDSVDGLTIICSNGTHAISADGTTISKRVVVRGVTGDPNDVALQPANLSYHNCVWSITLNNEGAILRDLTVAGKVGGNSCALRLNVNGGTATNCVIRDGMSNNASAYGAAVYLCGEKSLLTHCVITNNYQGGDHGDYDGNNIVHATKGRVSNCLFINNRIKKSSSGTLGILCCQGDSVADNCTVVSNSVVA